MKVSKEYKYVETLKRRPATNKEIKEYIKLQESLKARKVFDDTKAAIDKIVSEVKISR